MGFVKFPTEAATTKFMYTESYGFRNSQIFDFLNRYLKFFDFSRKQRFEILVVNRTNLLCEIFCISGYAQMFYPKKVCFAKKQYFELNVFGNFLTFSENYPANSYVNCSGSIEKPGCGNIRSLSGHDRLIAEKRVGFRKVKLNIQIFGSPVFQE